jgi:hypothetical protein
VDIVGAYGARYSGKYKNAVAAHHRSSVSSYGRLQTSRLPYLSLANVRAANGTLGSLHAESGLSIVAIKLSLIFLLFSQTKQHVSVLHGVSCVALGF